MTVEEFLGQPLEMSWAISADMKTTIGLIVVKKRFLKASNSILQKTFNDKAYYITKNVTYDGFSLDFIDSMNLSLIFNLDRHYPYSSRYKEDIEAYYTMNFFPTEAEAETERQRRVRESYKLADPVVVVRTMNCMPDWPISDEEVPGWSAETSTTLTGLLPKQ